MKTILAIDDDTEWLEFTVLALGDDYDVKTANCADDVVDLVGDLRPDLVILDVMMTEHKDGFTALAELKNDPKCCDVPVIIFSEVNVVTNMNFGMNELQTFLGVKPTVFLEKPVSAERLKKEVDKALLPA